MTIEYWESQVEAILNNDDDEAQHIDRDHLYIKFIETVSNHGGHWSSVAHELLRVTHCASWFA